MTWGVMTWGGVTWRSGVGRGDVEECGVGRDAGEYNSLKCGCCKR